MAASQTSQMSALSRSRTHSGVGPAPGLRFIPVAAPNRAELKGLAPTLAERIGHAITYRIATLIGSNTVAIGCLKLLSVDSPSPRAGGKLRRAPISGGAAGGPGSRS